MLQSVNDDFPASWTPFEHASRAGGNSQACSALYVRPRKRTVTSANHPQDGTAHTKAPGRYHTGVATVVPKIGRGSVRKLVSLIPPGHMSAAGTASPATETC